MMTRPAQERLRFTGSVPHSSAPPGSPGAAVIVAALLVPALLSIGLALVPEAQVLAVVAAALAALVALAQPFWGLAAFVVLVYTRPEENIPALQGMRVALGIAALTLLALQFHLVLRKERPVITPLHVMLAGMGFWAVLSSLPYGNTRETVEDVVKFFLLTWLVINLIRSRERYRGFITLLIGCTVYLAGYSILLYYRGHALLFEDSLLRLQATGIFGDPNDMATALATGVALVLARLIGSPGWRRLPYVVLMAPLLWAMLLTHSRSGFVALVAVCGGFFIALSVRYRLAGILLAVAMLGALLVVAPDRMKNFDREDASANQRFWFWANGVDYLSDHPLLGIGYKRFPEINDGRASHNSFVSCFTELGLPGYFSWMGCIYFCFRRRPEKAPPDEPEDRAFNFDVLGARIALVGFLAGGFFLTRTYNPVLYLLFCLPVLAQTSLLPAGARQRITWKDCAWIAFFCVTSIVGIKLLAEYLR